MLVGREQERRRIRSLIAAARVGQSASLVLTGEAGIGKTELLHDAAVSGQGMSVLRTTGTAAESEVPFGALLQLLRPALVHLPSIPAPQAAALGAALALRPGTGDDRFAVGAATLSLLSRFAEDQPVLVLLDDAHLLDLPSAQAVTFAARRLTNDPVLLLAAVREGRACPLTTADLPELRVSGLSAAAARDLVDSTGHRPSEAALARLHEATGGNPLALVELAGEVEALQATPFDLPATVPASLARAFGRRASGLSEAAGRAVLVAASGGDELDVLTRACRLLEVDVSCLAEAEQAGLLAVVAGRVCFRHTLVRSAVYSDAAPAARRAVHRAVADALPAHDDDRRAWHLGQAALGPDEEVARLLDGAAARARGRGAHAVAAAAWERAAELAPQPSGRVQRWVSGAESWWQAGLGDRAVPLLLRATELAPSAPLRTRIAGLQGSILARTGSVEQARDVLVAAGTDAAAHDVDEAVMLLGEAILACFFLGDTATVGTASEAIDRLAGQVVTGTALVVAQVASGVADVLTGRGGTERIRQAVAGVAADDLVATDPRVAPWLVLGPLFLRESSTRVDLVEKVVDSLRRRSVLGALPLLLFHVARDQATTDRWDVAELTYTEGAHLAREAGQATDLAACLAGLSWLEARQGREQESRGHADEARRLCLPRHLALFPCWSSFAAGELALGLGRAQAAVEQLLRLEQELAELGLVDVDLSPAPELAEALVHVGETGRARSVAADYADRAAQKGQPWACARAARATALTRPDAELDAGFGAALTQHEQTPDAFELARTQLSYGARMRRAGRRVDARPQLRAALSTLEALGAAPWAEQAARELRATGQTVARRGAREQLTPQELQVAGLLASGCTTREAAAALFLSPKTVEYHLRHVYGKLGISSRGQLADAVAARSAGQD